MPSNINKPKSAPVKNYAKNIFKSLTFATKESLKDSLPAVVEFQENNSELFQGLYKNLRDFKNTFRRGRNVIEQSPIMKMANEYLENAKKDLKSGQFINKDREREAIMASDDEFDFGMEDLNFNDEDDSLESSIDEDTSSSRVISANRANTAEVIGAVSELAKSNLASTEYLAENQKSLNNINLTLYTQKLNETNFHLNNISSGIGGMLNFYNNNMNKYFESSYQFYEQMLETQKEMYNIAKTQYDILYNNKNKTPMDNPESDLFDSSGTLNIQNYLSNIKKNMKTFISENSMGLDSLLTVMSDAGIKQDFIISPLGFIPKKIINTMLAPVLKKSMENFNASFSNFFKSLLLKFSRHRDSDNPILSFISNVFGIKNEKKSLDISDYHKGATPFDGITKKAIIEVIPTYLRKILSALTGDEERIYNYESAMYEKANDKRKQYKDSINTMYDSSVYESRNRIDELINKTYKFNDKQEKNNFNSDISNIFRFLIDRRYLFDPKKDTLDDLEELQGLKLNSRTSYDAFVGAFKNLKTNEKFKFNEEMMKAIENSNYIIDDLRDKLELKGVSNALSDWEENDKDGKRKVTRVGEYSDKFGETVPSYLRKILELLYKGIIVYPRNLTRGGRYPSHIKDGLQQLTGQSIKLDNEEQQKLSKTESSEREYLIDAEKSAKASNLSLINSIESMGDAKTIEEQIQNVLKKEQEDADRNTKSPKSKTLQALARIRDIPGKIVARAFDALDNLMYKIIYGTEKKGEDATDPLTGEKIESVGSGAKSLIERISENIKEMFKSAILDPLDKRLFDEKDGLIPKIKDKLKGFWNNISKSLLGEDFSLKNQGKSVWQKIKSGVNEILFGTPDRDDSGRFQKGKKGLLTGLQNNFYTYFNQLSSTLWGGKEGYDDTYGKDYKDQKFGGRKKFKQFREDLQKKFKERFPSMSIGGGLGLIGSFFLPGGPIFGTLLGAGIGFAKHSDTIKNLLFGEEIDDVDDKGNAIKVRKGNKVFSQKFMKKYKTEIEPMLPGLKKGMGMGALSSLLLGFGPITGLLLGGTISWAKQSESFKRFLFGGTDEKTGETKEGMLAKEIQEKIKKYMPSIGKGSGLGLISSLMIGGGPIFGILAGGALGLVSELDVVKDKVLGPIGEDGKRHGGWVDQLKDVAKNKILDPISKAIFGDDKSEDKGKKKGIVGKMKDWFKESIGDPFRAALKPLFEEMKIVGRSIADIFQDTFNSVFENAVGKPLGKLIEEKVVDPMKKFLSKLIGGIGRFVGKIISAPFKAFAAFSGGLAKDHLRSGVKDRQGERVSNYLDNMTDEQLKTLGLSRDDVNSYNREDKASGFSAVKRFADRIFGNAFKKTSDTSKKMQDSVDKFINNIFSKNAEHMSLSERFRLFMNTASSSDGIGGKFKSNWTKYMNKFSDIFKAHIKEEKNKSEVEKAAEEQVENMTKDKQKSNLQKNAEKQTAKAVNENITNSSTNVTGASEANKNKTEKESPFKTKSGNNMISILKNIEKYTGISSKEVNGQLDGVGYNIEKIKNILKNNFGDADATGLETERGNKKRRGIFGKIFDFLKHPFNFIKNLVVSPFKFIGGLFKDAFKPFFETLGSVTNAILSIPQHIIKILGSGVDLIVNGIKFAFEGITNVLNVASNIVMSSFEGLAHIVVGIGEAVGTAFSSLGDIVKTTISVVSELALQAIPKLIEGIGSLLDIVGKGLGWIGKGVASLFGIEKKKSQTKISNQIETVKRVKVVETINSIGQIKDVVKVYVTGGKLDKSGRGSLGNAIYTSSGSIIDDDSEAMEPIKKRKDVNFILSNRKKEEEAKRQKEMASDIDSIEKSSMITAKHMESNFGEDGLLSKLFGGGNSGFFGNLQQLWAALGPAVPSLLSLLAATPMLASMTKYLPKYFGLADQDSDGDGFADADKNKDGIVTFWDKLSYATKSSTAEFKSENQTNKRMVERTKAKMVRSSYKTVKKTATKFAANHPKAVAILTKFFDDFFTKVAKKFPKLKKFIPRMSKELGEKCARNITEEALQAISTVASGYILEVVFFLYDAFTGAVDAKNILQIPPDTPITWNMRMACASAKALSGLVMDIPSLFGVGWKEIAMWIYESMGEDIEIEQLKQAQLELRNQYNIALSNGFTGTFDDFNKKANKTFFKKSVDFGTQNTVAAVAINSAMLSGKPKDALKIAYQVGKKRFSQAKNVTSQLSKELGEDSILHQYQTKGEIKPMDIIKTIADPTGTMGLIESVKSIAALNEYSRQRREQSKNIPEEDNKINQSVQSISKSAMTMQNTIQMLATIFGVKIDKAIMGDNKSSSSNNKPASSTSSTKPKSVLGTVIGNLFKKRKSGEGSHVRLSGNGESESIVNNIQYYSQEDSEWGNIKYSGNQMKTTGCAPTSAAMVISTITGKRITPKDTVQFAIDGEYDFEQNGTDYTYISDILSKYGIKSSLYEMPIPKNAIKVALQNNKLVILLGRGREPFTDNGHFIVASAVSGGKISINDPISTKRSKQYKFNDVMKNTEAAWIIDRQIQTNTISGLFDDYGNALIAMVKGLFGVNPDLQLTSSIPSSSSSQIEESPIPQTTYNTVNIKHGSTYKAPDGTVYTKITAPRLTGGLTAGTKELLVSRLSRLGTDNNKNIDIASSYRSLQHQQYLYDLWKKGKGNLAASPGSSAHNFGLAIDVNSPWVKSLSDSDLKRYNLWKPISSEDWHIEPTETKGNRNKDKYPNVVLSGAGNLRKGKIQRTREGLYGFGTEVSIPNTSSSSNHILSIEVFDEILRVLKSIAENTHKASENKVTIVVDNKESVETPKNDSNKYMNTFLNIIDKNKSSNSVNIDYENAIIIAGGTL